MVSFIPAMAIKWITSSTNESNELCRRFGLNLGLLWFIRRWKFQHVSLLINMSLFFLRCALFIKIFIKFIRYSAIWSLLIIRTIFSRFSNRLLKPFDHYENMLLFSNVSVDKRIIASPSSDRLDIVSSVTLWRLSMFVWTSSRVDLVEVYYSVTSRFRILVPDYDEKILIVVHIWTNSESDKTDT